MRVTGPLLKVLPHLAVATQEGEGLYGLELSRCTGLKAGTLYPLLDRLETRGWVTAWWEDVDPSHVGRPRRRYYALTGLGENESRQVLAEYGVTTA